MAAVSKKYRNSGMELSTPLFHILQLLYRIHLNLIELHSKHKHIDFFTFILYNNHHYVKQKLCLRNNLGRFLHE